MVSKLIKLNDGILVEVEVASDEVQQISGGAAKKVDATLEKIKPVLLKICHSIAASAETLREDVDLEQLEVEVGMSFDLEGNVYLTKASFGTNVLVRMTLGRAQ